MTTPKSRPQKMVQSTSMTNVRFNDKACLKFSILASSLIVAILSTTQCYAAPVVRTPSKVRPNVKPIHNFSSNTLKEINQRRLHTLSDRSLHNSLSTNTTITLGSVPVVTLNKNRPKKINVNTLNPIYVHPQTVFDNDDSQFSTDCGSNAQLHRITDNHPDQEWIQTFQPTCVCSKGHACNGNACHESKDRNSFSPLLCNTCRCIQVELLPLPEILPEQEELPLKDGVLLIPTSMAGLSKPLTQTMLSTWVADLPSNWDVKLFVGGCNKVKETPLPSHVTDTEGNKIVNEHVSLVCIPTNDSEYPPQRKVLVMFDVVSRQYRKDYRYFVKLDTDTYFNIHNFKQNIVSQLAIRLQPNQPLYLGHPAKGRAGEMLGLMGEAYCLGLGYVLNQETLRRTEGKWSQCLSDVVSNHSDTEVARCLVKHANTSCTQHVLHHQQEQFRQLYFSYDDSTVATRSFSSNRRMVMRFPSRPQGNDFHATCIHSIKDPSDMARLHYQVHNGLRPLKPMLSMAAFAAVPDAEHRVGMYNQYKYHHYKSCVHNPVEQLMRYNHELTECALPPSVTPTNTNLPINPVIVGTQSSPELSGLKQQLSDQGFGESRVFTRPSTKESIWRPFLQAIRSALLNTSSSSQLFLVLHENAVLSCGFQKNMLKLLRTTRCGGFLLTNRSSGVLYLGPQTLPTSESAKEIILNDISAESTESHRHCFNVWNTNELECISGLYSREALVALEKWIPSKLNMTVPPKSCEAAAHLADCGFITRGVTTGLLLASNFISNSGLFGDLKSTTEGATGKACLEEYIY